jgi:predicted GIY-YIG superfamily endonuclease
VSARTYILLCADGSYYTGCTTNLEQRLGQHQAGEIDGYTSLRRPVRLVWSEEYQTIQDAIAAERQVKGWSRRKKAALIERRHEALPLLSKRGFKPHSSS